MLPEDDDNHRLANGFKLSLNQTGDTRFRILPVAGGWIKALNLFESDYIAGMDRYADRFMVLLIDFDGSGSRLNDAKSRIPERLMDRVFILGAWLEPKDLKMDLGSCETIGSKMARDCQEETGTTWSHELLQHNSSELARLRLHVRPILFPS